MNKMYMTDLRCIFTTHMHVHAKTFANMQGPALGGAVSNWEQFRSVQVPSQLAPRSVELGAGPNWEQLV